MRAATGSNGKGEQRRYGKGATRKGTSVASGEIVRPRQAKVNVYLERIARQNHHACNSRFVRRLDKFGPVLARPHLHARTSGVGVAERIARALNSGESQTLSGIRETVPQPF